ncbi:succinate dehydrogenase/fumarate reductase iron-sulfur subunit, partial [Candidatus Bathyarchaeota archaeon]|nr:succinate dehydrogenase/fumarate reductase iron-sulfur subunit [Candidatus Bathyarchaeota archaeon]
MASEVEKIVKFEICRFNSLQKRHYTSTYKVPVRKGMTLLEALMYIKDNFDETLSFRHSCRMGICGSCGIMVNGQPMLACYTQVLHLNSDSVVIEPLQNMPVIKDLVVDVQPFFDTYNRIKTVLIKPEDESKKPEESIQAPSELKRFWDLTLCTKCAICYSSCPAAIDEKFLGPSAYSTNYRFLTDSRDKGSEERLRTIANNVWLCT